MNGVINKWGFLAFFRDSRLVFVLKLLLQDIGFQVQKALIFGYNFHSCRWIYRQTIDGLRDV